jgi:hypothetical protein
MQTDQWARESSVHIRHSNYIQVRFLNYRITDQRVLSASALTTTLPVFLSSWLLKLGPEPPADELPALPAEAFFGSFDFDCVWCNPWNATTLDLALTSEAVARVLEYHSSLTIHSIISAPKLFGEHRVDHSVVDFFVFDIYIYLGEVRHPWSLRASSRRTGALRRTTTSRRIPRCTCCFGLRGGSMQIFVRTLTDKDITLDVESSDSIEIQREAEDPGQGRHPWSLRVSSRRTGALWRTTTSRRIPHCTCCFGCAVESLSFNYK